MPKGKPHPAELKARVAIEAMHGEKTVSDVAAGHGLNPNLVRKWVAKAESEMARVFTASEDERARERELAEHREEADGGDEHAGGLSQAQPVQTRQARREASLPAEEQGGIGRRLKRTRALFRSRLACPNE